MLESHGVAEGHLVDTHHGGEGVLKRMLDDVRKFGFSGYLKSSYSTAAGSSEGMIGFNSGEPSVTIYVFKKAGSSAERVYQGQRAAEFIWEDSMNAECSLSLHSRISVQDLEKRFAEAKVGRVELLPPPSIGAAKGVGEIQRLAGKEDAAAQRILAWAKEGYNVSNLVRLYLTDPSAATRALPYFEANIQRLQSLEEVLRLLDTEGYEREAESLERRMHDPERLLDLEGELEELRRRIEGYEVARAEEEIRESMERKAVDEKIDSVYDLILQYHRQQSGESAAPTCEVCGSPLQEDGACPKCASYEPKPRFGRSLNPRFTFDSFVSGPSNRFAEAAAKAVAENPGKSYNPLFLYSKSGLGKTHLLQAIGNKIASAGGVVTYAPTDVFEAELIGAVTNNTLEEMRKAYRGSDALLIDDVQFLTGKERIQEELFQAFTEITERRGQVVLAADRMPKEIPSLSERLISRFESGLVADIQPCDYETRRAILERRVTNEKLDVPPDVLLYIAEVCKDNVRQLEGGLNRVVAFSSLMHSTISISLAQEILRQEERNARRQLTPKVELLSGKSYLLEEQKPDFAHRLFVGKVREGRDGLAIVRGHPRGLRQRLEQTEAAILWLTDKESKEEATIPPSLERIMVTVEEFMEDSPKAVILLDDVQYLISNNAFEGLARFVRTLVDEVSERDAIFILSIDPEGLKPQERSVIEREMEVVRT
ncbi:MAG: DUF835 domain-containing protein [Methanomassiliicoccales archaeon]|nr:DUF835 domain-containing protein [Methanomassiliicoccales archaeon]